MLPDMEKKKPPTPISEKLLTNVRAFQKFLNRTCAPTQQDISLNSTAVMFLLGDGIIRIAPHGEYLRFEWSLPYFKGVQLLRMIANYQCSHVGFLLAIDIGHLCKGGLFQIQASRESLNESPDMDGPEC